MQEQGVFTSCRRKLCPLRAEERSSEKRKAPSCLRGKTWEAVNTTAGGFSVVSEEEYVSFTSTEEATWAQGTGALEAATLSALNRRLLPLLLQNASAHVGFVHAGVKEMAGTG